MELYIMYTFDEKTVSDLHKDAYGFRPTPEFSILWELSSDDQKQELWDSLLTALANSIEEEEAREKASVEDFESRVAATAKDREAGILQVVRALNLTKVEKCYGGEYACFQLGLPFSYAKELDTAVAKLQQV